MAQVETEKTSYGGFERFLFYAIPIIFTVLLTGVLLTVFGYDVVNGALKTANKIPYVKTLVPAPKPDTKSPKGTLAQKSTPASSNAEQAEDVQAKLADKDKEINALTDASKKKDQDIKDLQTSVASLQDQLKQKTQTEEEYLQKIKTIADMYAQMTPSKAGPILQTLTMKELVLVLNEMTQASRVAVLEKIDPKIAGEASIQLKDIVSVKEQEIAALQSRLDIQKPADPKAAAALTNEDVSKTFGTMTPKSAATVLLEMNKINQAKVLSILTSMDTSQRSSVLGAMADLNKEETAKISAKL